LAYCGFRWLSDSWKFVLRKPLVSSRAYTEGVTGSIPVAPTKNHAKKDQPGRIWALAAYVYALHRAGVKP